MSLDALKAALPPYAKDISLNLGSIVTTSSLPKTRLWGTVLACAVASRNAEVLRHLEAAAAEHLDEASANAARGAATIMAMNNVYYRATHLIGDPEYPNMPARLRMQIIGNPGVDKVDFELWCLAVSAIFGCGTCLTAHERVVREAGETRQVVQEMLRIGAVVHAAAVALESVPAPVA